MTSTLDRPPTVPDPLAPPMSSMGAGWSVDPPPPHRCAAVWDGPVPRADTPTRAPLVWLLGAHGGAGTSVLACSLAFAGDAERRWPARVGFTAGQDSPLVVVVARTAMSSLAAAHDLLLQHAAGATPAGVRLLGLVTIADTDRALARPVAARRDLVEHLATDLDAQAWRLGWIEAWRSLTTAELPVWTPGTPVSAERTERRDPTRTAPLSVRHLGTDIFRAAADQATALRSPTVTVTDLPRKGRPL